MKRLVYFNLKKYCFYQKEFQNIKGNNEIVWSMNEVFIIVHRKQYIIKLLFFENNRICVAKDLRRRLRNYIFSLDFGNV